MMGPVLYASGSVLLLLVAGWKNYRTPEVVSESFGTIVLMAALWPALVIMFVGVTAREMFRP